VQALRQHDVNADAADADTRSALAQEELNR
jgi:hypothetical protein